MCDFFANKSLFACYEDSSITICSILSKSCVCRRENLTIMNIRRQPRFILVSQKEKQVQLARLLSTRSYMHGVNILCIMHLN